MATNNAKEGTVVIANHQKKGRGRFDRKFFSPTDSGIYMSILFRPNRPAFDTTLLTPAAAVSVALAIEKISGKKAEIKWVNDVLINKKKVCGILTEGVIDPKTNTLKFVILGIGINAFTPKNGFNEEIKNIAGAVFDHNSEELKSKLTAQVIDNIFEFYNNFEMDKILDNYRKRSAVLGKEITVIKGDKNFIATALSIDNNCRLLVEYPDKTQELLSSGEISIKF